VRAEAGETMAMAKAELRKELMAQREALGAAARVAADERIARAVQDWAGFQEAPLVLAYVSVGAEVDTRALIAAALAQGKQVAVPRCVPGTRCMEWYRIEGPKWLEGLRPSAFGIPEPAENPDTLLGSFPANALALVPGLAFDRAGFRIGYGGGYYDRFLAQFPGRALGLVRNGFLLESLATLGAADAHDLPVPRLATEAGVIAAMREG